jgi:mRNA-degrading endonuclease RelE of RelBE toxin-antitoxin system
MPASSLEVTRHPGFERDLKRLMKKYPSLLEDLATFQRALLLAHGNPDLQPEAMGFFPLSMPGLEAEDCFTAKRFACKSLRGSGSQSGIRVVYRIDRECIRLLYIEIFHKNEKPVPDYDRLRKLD